MAIGVFKNHSFEIVNNLDEADIIVINTCGFIEPAKQEAINTILEAANKKCRGGRLCPPVYEERQKKIPSCNGLPGRKI